MMTPGLLLALAAAAPLKAAAPSGPLELARVLERVRERNPEIRAAQLDVEEARAMVPAARAWPDPEIGVEYWGMPRPGLDPGAADQRMIDISQTIPFPTRTLAASQVAGHELARRQAGAEGVLEDRQRAAKEAWWDLWAATSAARALAESGATLDDLAGLSDRRNRLGQVGRMEQLMDPMAKMARLDLENELLQLAQDRRTAEVALNRLMGAEPELRLADPDTAPGTLRVDLNADDVMRRALAGRAELQEAHHHLLHTRARRRLAAAGWMPDLMVQYSLVDNRGGAPMGMVMAKVNVPFVWFWRQRGEAAAAARMEEQADVELAGRERETRELVTTRLAALRTDGARLDRLEREVLPLAGHALRLGVAGYRSGSVGVADALGAVAAYRKTALEVIDLTARLGRTRAALEQLVRGDLNVSQEKELHHEGH